MKPRYVRTALVAGVALAVTGLPVATVASAALPAVGGSVTMVTGDQVAVSQAPDARLSFTAQSAAGGAARSFPGANGDSYLVPAVAQPFLGKQLDPSLFDLTALARDGLGERIPVTLTFAGGVTPSAPPGVTVTAIHGTSADGFLTQPSGREFAAALRAGIGADVAAGRRPVPDHCSPG